MSLGHQEFSITDYSSVDFRAEHLILRGNYETGALSNLAVTLLVASLSPLAWKQLRAKRHDETEAIFHYI